MAATVSPAVARANPFLATTHAASWYLRGKGHRCFPGRRPPHRTAHRGDRVPAPVASRLDSFRARGDTAAVLRIGTIVINVGSVERASAFWRAALGYLPRRGYPEDPDFLILVPQTGAGTGTHLALNQSDAPPQEMPHVHLDLYAGDADDQAAEVERLVGLGASRVDWPFYEHDADYIVLADPDGNRFCVINTGQS
jgi:catechol 2,3-dioxygenase-like lactoylglutathione lyase family enzyme